MGLTNAQSCYLSFDLAQWIKEEWYIAPALFGKLSNKPFGFVPGTGTCINKSANGIECALVSYQQECPLCETINRPNCTNVPYSASNTKCLTSMTRTVCFNTARPGYSVSLDTVVRNQPDSVNYSFFQARAVKQRVDYGPLTVWWYTAKSLREALMGAGMLDITNNGQQIDILVAVTNSVSVIVAASFTFLIAAVALIYAPLMARKLYLSVMREQYRARLDELESREAKMRENEKEKYRERTKEERDMLTAKLGIGKKKGKNEEVLIDDDDASEQLHLYSYKQKMFVIFVLLCTTGLNIAFLIVAAVGTATSDNAFQQMRTTSLQSLAGLDREVAAMSVQMQNTYLPGTYNDYVNSLLNSPRATFDASVFSPVATDSQAVENALYAVQSNADRYIQLVQQVSTIVADINNKLSELNSFLYTTKQMSLLDPAEFIGCTLNPNFAPFLDTNPSIIADFSTIVNSDTVTNGLRNVFATARGNFSFEALTIQTLREDFQYQFNNVSYVTLANQVRSVGNTISQAGPTAFNRMRNDLRLGVYNTRRGFNFAGSLIATKSNGAYVAIMFAFLAILTSCLAILFGQWNLARGLNVCQMILLSSFWLLCGVTLIFAFANAHVCRAVSDEYQIRNWTKGLEQVSAYGMDVPLETFTQEIYTSRMACYANNSYPISQLFLNYGGGLLNDSDNRQSFRVSLAPDTNAQIIQERANSNYRVDTPAYRSASAKLLIWFSNIVQNRNAILTQLGLAITQLNSAPFQQYDNAANQPIFTKTVAQELDDVIRVLNNFNASINSTMFSPPTAQCSTQWRVGFSRVVLPRVTDAFNQRINYILGQQRNLSATAASIRVAMQAADYQSQVYSNASASVGLIADSEQFTRMYTYYVNSIRSMVTKMDSFIYELTQKIFRDLTKDSYKVIRCDNIAAQTYQAEDQCTLSVVGLDSAYWAFGALGVVYFFQIQAVRMAVERLKEDSSWLVMAMLLRSTAQDQEKANATMKVPKVNNTGTSYLEENDFDVNFNDPSMMHTRF